MLHHLRHRITRAGRVPGVAAVLAADYPRPAVVPPDAPPGMAERVVPNDSRAAAGTLHDGVLIAHGMPDSPADLRHDR